MEPMSLTIGIVAVLVLLLAVAVIALRTGLARQVFFEIYSRVAEVEVLGPNTVRIPPAESPYDRWVTRAKAEIPVFEGLVIEDVSSINLRPWPQMGDGVSGLYLRMADYQASDGRILEIPARGNTASQRQLVEQGIYFMGGPGHTIIQQDGAKPEHFEWQEGALFSIPLNVRHQHFNDSDNPVRLIAITSFPFMLNALNSERFINENSFAFTDRYDAAPDYHDRSERTADDWITTNLVADILRSETGKVDLRGRGNRVMHWAMAGNSMLSAHASEIPPRAHKKAHRHSNDSTFLLLSGEGYTLAWPGGRYHKKQRVDWKAGTLFVPPTYWYHQHFNAGSTPARYLSINMPDLLSNLGLRYSDQMNVDLGEVKEEWRKELEKRQHDGR